MQQREIDVRARELDVRATERDVGSCENAAARREADVSAREQAIVQREEVAPLMEKLPAILAISGYKVDEDVFRFLHVGRLCVVVARYKVNSDAVRPGACNRFVRQHSVSLQCLIITLSLDKSILIKSEALTREKS